MQVNSECPEQCAHSDYLDLGFSHRVPGGSFETESGFFSQQLLVEISRGTFECVTLSYEKGVFIVFSSSGGAHGFSPADFSGALEKGILDKVTHEIPLLGRSQSFVASYSFTMHYIVVG